MTKGCRAKKNAEWLSLITATHFLFCHVMIQFFKFRPPVAPRDVSWSLHIIFPPYTVLHKSQLLVSLSLHANNRSNLFLMASTSGVWQIDPRRKACADIWENTRCSRSECARLGEVGYFRNTPIHPPPSPTPSLAAEQPISPHISKEQSAGGLAHIPGMDTETILTKCQGRKQGKINMQTRYVLTWIWFRFKDYIRNVLVEMQKISADYLSDCKVIKKVGELNCLYLH